MSLPRLSATRPVFARPAVRNAVRSVGARGRGRAGRAPGAGPAGTPVEAMEPRRLMAADPSIVQEGYTVTATGTDAADVITVEPAGTDGFRVTINGSLTRTFGDEDGVAVLHLKGLGGNDQITAAPGLQKFVEFIMYGDAGTDTLTSQIPTYFRGGEVYRANGRTVAAEQADGGLLVFGTAGADRFELDGNYESDGEQVLVGDYFHGHFGPRAYFRVDAGGGNDALGVGDLFSYPVRFNGQDGDDAVGGGSSSSPLTARGGAGNDTLLGSEGNDLLYGDGGNDVIRGFGGDDFLDGGDGTDQLDGGTGNDTLVNGEGAAPGGPSTIVVDDSGNVVATGTDGADVIVAERVGVDDIRVTVNGLTRTFDDDDIIGIRLNGLGGDDRITTIGDVRQVNDVDLNGGAGVDTLTIGSARLSGGEIFRAADGRTVATRQADGSLRVVGTAGADSISVFGTNEADGERVAIDAEDYFLGYFGEGQFTYYQIDGGAGDDNLRTPDVIFTPVRLNGGDGNDVISAGRNQVPITARGGAGNDTLHGYEGNDLLYGDGGNDVIRAGGGNDRMEGGDGNDLLDGGEGADEFIGGLGTDLADYSYRFDNLTIGIGTNPDDGAAGEGDNVRTGVENVTTGSGNDTIRGDGARNVLRGGDGSDTIHGNGGDDFINPGSGADRVYAGSGNDSIYARDGIKDLVLDGGTGTDRAQKDASDPRTSIEQLIA